MKSLVQRMHRPDYGLDAPGHALLAAVLTALGAALLSWSLVTDHAPSSALGAVLTAFALVALYFTLRSSLVGTLRLRDMLISDLVAKGHLSGSEKVLDLGCHKGIMLLPLAQRLSSGSAVGVALPRALPYFDMAPSLWTNARILGVEDRIDVVDSALASLPFADEHFDLVTLFLTLRHFPDKGTQEKILDESLRVLRPGGAILVVEHRFTEHHAEYLREKGCIQVERTNPWLTTTPPSRAVYACKPL